MANLRRRRPVGHTANTHAVPPSRPASLVPKQSHGTQPTPEQARLALGQAAGWQAALRAGPTSAAAPTCERGVHSDADTRSLFALGPMALFTAQREHYGKYANGKGSLVDMSSRPIPVMSGKPSSLLRSVVAAAVLAGSLAAAFLAPSQLAWAAPPPLTGESFNAGLTSGDGGTLVTSATCSQTSPSTVTFTATGSVPSGPYPGSFTESGDVTVSATQPSPAQFTDGVPLYEVSTIDTFFSITSAAGTVEGIEHLAESGAVLAICATFNDQPFGNLNDTVTGFFRHLQNAADGFGASYDAIITTPGGSFQDIGKSGLDFEDLNVTAQSGTAPPNVNFLSDGFVSSSLTPVSGVGNVTGGGQISTSTGRVAFGFEAKSENGLKGQCDVVDRSAGVKIHCFDVTSWARVSATEVKFFGEATVNGTPTSFVIDTQDLADPGIGADTFAISTGTGYHASGTLTRGNIQIHRR